MRNSLVFDALEHINNRYELCHVAAKATRKLHKPRTRLQDTTNDVLVLLTSPHNSKHHHKDSRFE
ncbi:MAG: DNA-directed RNA polymerase subunit omega [Terracidiphilus sp.]|jgi:DNA-directed RNA polymerase omega subunit